VQKLPGKDRMTFKGKLERIVHRGKGRAFGLINPLHHIDDQLTIPFDEYGSRGRH
jgi:hypothetical protein